MTQYIACNLEAEGLEPRFDVRKRIWCVAFYTGPTRRKMLLPNYLEDSDGRIDKWLSEGGGLCLEWGDRAKDLIKWINHTHEFKFVFHNAAYDVACIRTHGGDIMPNRYEDSQALAYCLFPSLPTGLAPLARHWLDRTKKPQPPFDKMSEELYLFNLEQVDLTYHLWHALLEEAKEWENVLPFYDEIERPYIERIMCMEKTGSYINRQELEVAIKAAKEERNKHLVELFKFCRSVPKKPTKSKTNKHRIATGMVDLEEFNPDSDHHIRYYLYEVLKVPISKQTKGGNPSIDKYVLASLSEKDGVVGEFARTLDTYNGWQTYLNTFLLTIEELLDKRMLDYGLTDEPTNLIRTNFKQFHVNTGRLSSRQPNLQNIPARGDRGAAIRRMFLAPENCALVVGDLDRIELCVLAFYLEAVLGYALFNDRIKTDPDVHQSNTNDWSAIVGKELERKHVKNATFATIYGCGIRKFAQTLGITVEQAKKIFGESELMLSVQEMRRVFINECRQNGGVIQNFFGRNLYIPNLMARDKAVQASGERQVFNYMIQSTAGDVFKLKQLQAVRLEIMYDLRQSLVVHDECIYIAPYNEPVLYVDLDEARKEYLDKVCEDLSNCYSDNEILKTGDVWTPVSCKFHWANNWYDAKGE